MLVHLGASIAAGKNSAADITTGHGRCLEATALPKTAQEKGFFLYFSIYFHRMFERTLTTNAFSGLLWYENLCLLEVACISVAHSLYR